MKSKNFLKATAKGAAFVIFIAILFAALTVTAYAQIDKNARIVVDYTNTPTTGTVSINLVSAIAPLEARVRIEKDGMQYDYRLKNDGTAEFFPLQMGNGEYLVRVLIGPVPDSGGRFQVGITSTYRLRLSSSNVNAVFLSPSQFVNFNRNSKITAKAAELVKDANARTDLEKIEAIYKFVIEELEYDMDKADRVVKGEMAGYVPIVDEILSAGMGICFDYATVFAAMLRSQNIPAKLVMGNVANPDPKMPAGSTVYHAWNEFYLKERGGWFKINEMRFTGEQFERVDPTFDSTGNGTTRAMQFIGNGSNYMKFKEY